jgi:hypothetical protein
MNRNAGFALAAILALTAAVRIPGSHTAASGVTTVEAAKPALHKPSAHAPAAQTGYSGGCTAYDADDASAPPDDNRAAAKSVLDKFFGSAPSEDTGAILRNQPGVTYAIALAADPRHTNLSLVFDRQMAAVQQAAQDESYTYDSSWMPWNLDQQNLPLLADQQAADDLAAHREACPGMLLFRKSVSAHGPASAAGAYQQALVVLVVGEQPTAGINQDQWQNALRWIANNASAQPQMLRVLGPSFSGSMVSLARNLVQLYPAQPDPAGPWSSFNAKFPQVRVLSGSVSDCASIRWFQQLHWQSVPGSPLPSVIFGAFAENDDREIFDFLSYLKGQGTEANDTAILSEDETAYSGKLAHPDEPAPTTDPCSFDYPAAHRPISLFFPRDISALRSAYEKQSIFATSASTQGAQTIHPILEEGGESGEESGNPSDTIQAYSRHLTPIAQEAVLYGIVSYMRAHHTRYVLLRCTNPLDFLFLTRFFHRAYPEGRIVTVGSDLLFRREIDTTEFRGVLALSNYPLLPRNQHWSNLSEHGLTLPGHAHRAFETATTEGTYVAARYLFSDGQELAQPKLDSTYISLPLIESIPEYADPFWLHSPREVIRDAHAPVWVTVVGRDGYWPLAVLNDASTPRSLLGEHQMPPPSTMVRLTSTKAHYSLAGDGKHFDKTLRSKLPLSWTICASLGFALLLYQLCGIVAGDRNSSQGLFSVFRRVSAPSQDILLGINSAFAAMLLLAPMTIGLTFPKRGLFAAADREYTLFLWAGVLLLLATCVALLRRRGVLALGCFLGFFLALGGLSILTLETAMLGGHAAEQANRVPLFYRIGHITAGVAPLLPVLFLFAGFYLWTWHAMAGNTLLCNGRPVLPKLERVEETTGFLRWYWVLLGNQVGATGRGPNRLNRSQIRMSQELGKRICAMASPLGMPLSVIALPALLLIGALICFHTDIPLLGLEDHAFALWLNLGLLFAFLLIGAEASRLFWTWMQLRRLLSKLNRLRLRRTFARLRAIEANSLWSVSGGVQRVQYLFFSQQLEAAIRLSSHITAPCPYLRDAIVCGKKFDRLTARKLSKGPRWDQAIYRPSDGSVATIRDIFADAVAEVYNRILWPWWASEHTSLTLATVDAESDEKRTELNLPLSEDPGIQTAEEFVCFQYIAFIQNTLARMRTMTLSMVLLFISVSLAISFYPFVPRTQISLWMIVNLALIGTAVVYVYAGMDRDEVLSYLTNTRPGRLSGEFWLKSAAFLAGPVLGILTTQFPSVADSILGWVQPGLDAIGK